MTRYFAQAHRRFQIWLYLPGLVCLLYGSLTAQENKPVIPADTYKERNERMLIGVKWRYTYTMHVESATIVHQADKNYAYFLHFRYDNTYEQYLNGKLTKGDWSVATNTLNYSFKNVKLFEVAEISSRFLALEFEQPNSNGKYKYFFKSVAASESPFTPAPGELPEVVIKGKVFKYKKEPWWTVFRKKKEPAIPKPEPINITVELIGGGYYGGIDAVQKDYIIIKSDGRLIKEFQSIANGLSVTKKNIPREELERFVEFVRSQKFFDMDRFYDCNTQVCLKRKKQDPPPIPLRLAISYGNLRKVVTISIWGEDNRHVKYVEYPPALDNIVDAIQRMAHRIDPKVQKSQSPKVP